jgi:ABC-type glycerol-3-phosphate transport system substrate-binding protein
MSIFKIIITAVGIIAAVFSVLIFSGKISINTGSKVPQGSITVWGTLPQEEMTNFFLAYARDVKGQQVTYQFIQEENFSATLVDALASGVGPDAIIAPYQLILEQSKRIYPFPQASFPEKMYRDMYVDGASIFWTRNGALALPIAIEPMVLFFNRTLLAKHGVALPPEYWDELNDMGPKLTVLTPQGTFTESAIALGAYGNVVYAKDILSTIVAQLGQAMVFKQPTSEGKDLYTVTANAPLQEGGDVFPLATALRFFMEFSNPTKIKYTWNQFLPNAQDQFVAEKLALYVGYYGEGKIMRERNGRIDFDMAVLPQTRGYNTFVTGMKLYGMATLSSARNKEVSFAVQSKVGSLPWANLLTPTIGALPPQRAYAQNPTVPETTRRSLLVAKGWYDIQQKNSSDLFETMVRDVTSGRVEVSEAASQFVQRLRPKYTN